MANKSKYMPYAQAKAAALDLQLTSRSAYQNWHRETKCEYLPLYPERAYAREWESWNEWLGTANVFRGDIDAPVRNMWDAVKWAQEFASAHDISTMNQWLAYHKENPGALPADIPLRPDTRYVEWNLIGWRTWLGTDVRGKVEAARHATAIFAIASFTTLSLPGNYYAVIQAEHGEAELREIIDRNPHLKVLRMYKLTAEDKEIAFKIVQAYGREEDGAWYIPRLNDMVFDLDMNLAVYKSGIPVG